MGVVQVESLKKNYGVINNFQRKEVKEKIKEYWEENPDRLAKVKLKQKETSLKKYGVDNPSKHPDIIQKIKQTHLKKIWRRKYYANTRNKRTIT